MLCSSWSFMILMKLISLHQVYIPTIRSFWLGTSDFVHSIALSIVFFAFVFTSQSGHLRGKFYQPVSKIGSIGLVSFREDWVRMLHQTCRYAWRVLKAWPFAKFGTHAVIGSPCDFCEFKYCHINCVIIWRAIWLYTSQWESLHIGAM